MAQPDCRHGRAGRRDGKRESCGKESSPEEIFFQKELCRQVQDAVAGLEEKYRIPVFLYYSQQFSTEQIGKILKLPQGTVKSRLYKARKLLKKELEVVFNER